LPGASSARSDFCSVRLFNSTLDSSLKTVFAQYATGASQASARQRAVILD
jgi:hypothetical protein